MRGFRLALVLAMVCAALGMAQSQQPPANTADRQQAVHEAEHLANEGRIANGTVWLAGVTTMLFIATGLLGYFTYRLWNATKRLAIDAENTAKEQGEKMDASVAAAVQSATAMEHSVEQARRNAVAELRAYVSVSIKSTTEQNTGYDRPYSVFLTIKNTGTTPAHGVTVRAKCAVLDYPPNSRMTWEADPFPPVRHVQVVFPGEDMPESTEAVGLSSDEDMAAVRKGSPKQLFVWVTVEYVDAFDESRQTLFCQSIRFDGNASFTAVNTEAHNSAT